MRYIYQNVVQDGRGNFVASATVTVTLAGGTTKASIYSALTGGTVDADGIITTGTDGTFAFYVDEDDYSHSQQFRIVWSKSGFTSETWDYIQIFPDGDRTAITDSTADQGDSGVVGTIAWHIADAAGTPIVVKLKIDTQYYVATTFTIPAGSSLVCDGRAMDPRAASDLESYGGLIYLVSTATINMAESSAIKNIILLRYGIVFPANAAEVANFAGTAITIVAGAHGVLIENMNIIGFALAISSPGWTEQPRITRVNFDCLAGIYIINCSDTAEISFCHGWPSASIDLGGVADADLQRSGIAYRIEGPNTQARVLSSFSYGYEYGVYLEDTNGVAVIDSSAEYTDTTTTTPEGIHTTGSNTDVVLIGFQTYNQYIGASLAGTDAVWSITRLIGCSFGATDTTAVILADGDLIVTGTKFISATVGITNNSGTANKITVTGNSFNAVTTAYSDSTTADVETEWIIGEDNYYTSVTNYGYQLTLPIFIDTDATPDVSNHRVWRTGNTGGAVDITDFDGLIYDGKELIILGADGGNSTVKHDIAKINMVGGADFVIGDGDVLHLIYDGTDWNEVSRANNTVA